MIRSYVVAAVGEWNEKLFKEMESKIDGDWHFCSNPDELEHMLTTISPRYIFFPHWRWIVPKNILDKFECVCFHMTDVPYGQGGSPLQNLITRGHKDTKLTALRMEEGLDEGPVYFKKPLTLAGTAYEIYQRAAELTWDMITEIVEREPHPCPQTGESVIFKRRKPEESEIPQGLSVQQVYDYIRMLDAPRYPNAFLDIKDYRLEFDKAELDGEQLTAKVKIFKRG